MFATFVTAPGHLPEQQADPFFVVPPDPFVVPEPAPLAVAA